MIVQINDGIVLYFYPSGTSPLHIRINETSAQDLNVDLGPPNRIHYKEDERMTIHSPQHSEENSAADCMGFQLVKLQKNFLKAGVLNY